MRIAITKIVLIRELHKPDVINMWPDLPMSLPGQLPTFNFKVSEGDGERYIRDVLGVTKFDLINVGEPNDCCAA